MRPDYVILLPSVLILSLCLSCQSIKAQASFLEPDIYPDFLRGGTRELKFIPGVGYADPFAIALIASIPVLVLIGFGIFFAPLLAIIPKFLAIPGLGLPGIGLGGVSGIAGGLGGIGGPIGSRTRRASTSFASNFNADKVAAILKTLESALEMVGKRKQ